MIWLECIVITLIVVAVAVKFYNIGYNECVDEYEEKYDFKDEVKKEVAEDGK